MQCQEAPTACCSFYSIILLHFQKGSQQGAGLQACHSWGGPPIEKKAPAHVAGPPLARPQSRRTAAPLPCSCRRTCPLHRLLLPAPHSAAHHSVDQAGESPCRSKATKVLLMTPSANPHYKPPPPSTSSICTSLRYVLVSTRTLGASVRVTSYAAANAQGTLNTLLFQVERHRYSICSDSAKHSWNGKRFESAAQGLVALQVNIVTI